MTGQGKADGADVGRRGFIGALAGLTAGTAAFVAPALVGEAEAQTSVEERNAARYQPDSAHVQRF
ncbi:hypothetical protein BH23PSE1_BH23PSE1_09540 [soil metagenome]